MFLSGSLENENPEPEDPEHYAYWTFDTLIGSNMTEDLSLYHNNANVSGATLTEGIKDKALYFDGIDDEVGALVDLPPTNLTIELWFKTTKTNTGLFSVLASPESIDDDECHFYLVDGRPHQQIPPAQVWSADVSLADGLWHYWVWTLEEEKGQKLYIDGEMVGNNSLDHSGFGQASRLNIGYSSMSAQPYFEGAIDEVKVHKGVLNATVIAENYESSYDNGQDTDDGTEDKEYLIPLTFLLLICVGAVVVVGIIKTRKDKTQKQL